MTLYVDDRHTAFDEVAAYAAAVVLAAISLAVVLLMGLLRRDEPSSEQSGL